MASGCPRGASVKAAQLPAAMMSTTRPATSTKAGLKRDFFAAPTVSCFWSFWSFWSLWRAGGVIGPDFLRFEINNGRLNRSLRLSRFISFIHHGLTLRFELSLRLL